MIIKECYVVKIGLIFLELSTVGQLGVVLLIGVNVLLLMGLKLRWFRARMKFGSSSQDKYETVTGIGFKPNAELFSTHSAGKEDSYIKDFSKINFMRSQSGFFKLFIVNLLHYY